MSGGTLVAGPAFQDAYVAISAAARGVLLAALAAVLLLTRTRATVPAA